MLDDRLAHLVKEYDDVLARLASPEVLTDQRAIVALSRRAKALEPIVTTHRRHQAALDDLSAAKDMLGESSGADREFLRAQVEEAETSITALEEQLRCQLVPRDANEDKN